MDYVCWNSSYFNLKEVDKGKYKAIFYSPGTKLVIRRISIVFVDNTNHYSNRKYYNEKMQKIINKYWHSCEATREKIKGKKSYLCY